MRIATNKVGRLTTRLLPPSQALVVSVHDVCPATWAECSEIYMQLAEIGVKLASWLVVPDYHRLGHILDNDDFCGWLISLAEGGHETVMHGYFHQRERQPRESLAQKFTTRFYTADEREFYDLDRDAALALVSQAQEDFRIIGVSPDGFIAPAWLLSEGAEQALRDANVQYTTRLTHVRDLHSGRTYESQSLVWSTRSAWRRQMSLAWNATLVRSLADNPLMRISIHPADIRHPRIWKQIRSMITEALRWRLAFTYERWIARQRTFVPASPSS